MQSIKSDDYLLNLLKGTVKDMKEIHEKIGISFKEDLEKLKRIGNELKLELEAELKSALERMK